MFTTLLTSARIPRPKCPAYSTFSSACAVCAGFFAHALKKLLFGGGDFAFFRGDGDGDSFAF